MRVPLGQAATVAMAEADMSQAEPSARLGEWSEFAQHDSVVDELDRIARKKRDHDGLLTFLCVWKGKDKDGKPWPRTWEPEKNINPQMVDEFVNPPEPTTEPFVLAAPELVAPDVADLLVAEWADQVGRSAAALLMRQREEFACRRLYAMSPCPPWLFLALWRRLGQMADGPDDLSDITAVKGHRGGNFVEDKFEVAATDLVEKIVAPHNTKGHGALVFRENNTAVMLVPPLDFTFKTRRDNNKTELVMTGHFMCLVDRKGKKGPRWAFDDERAAYDDTNKHAYKLAVAAAMRELGEGVVPARMREFLALLE